MVWDPGTQQRRLPPADSSDPMNVVFNGDIPAHAGYDGGITPPAVFYPVVAFEAGEAGIYQYSVSSPDKPNVSLFGTLVVSDDGSIFADTGASHGSDNTLYAQTNGNAYEIAYDHDDVVRAVVRLWKVA